MSLGYEVNSFVLLERIAIALEKIAEISQADPETQPNKRFNPSGDSGVFAN